MSGSFVTFGGLWKCEVLRDFAFFEGDFWKICTEFAVFSGVILGERFRDVV